MGTILIGYPDGAIIFSFQQNKILKHFRYEAPPWAPSGAANSSRPDGLRQPKLIHALWHPTGTFVLTAHEDSSLVFWDPRDGRLVEARTLQNLSVHRQPPQSPEESRISGSGVSKPAYGRIAWCSKQNPDDTGLLIASSAASPGSAGGLTFLDLGQTPNYQTSSWERLAKYFQEPKRTHMLPVPSSTEVIKYELIPRSSPHYAGAHDPVAIMALLSSGEMITLSLPSGHPISPTNQLHPSLTFVQPFVSKIALACVGRTQWLGTRELREQGPIFLTGGAEETKRFKCYGDRNVVQTAHADGTVRIWDVGHGDEIENNGMLQADLARALGRFEDISLCQISMNGTAGEMSLGLTTGEVVIFRLNRNQYAKHSMSSETPEVSSGHLTDISTRADPTLKEGLLPLTLLGGQQGPVTALEHSDVGFVAVGVANCIIVLDLRGPAIIFRQSVGDLVSSNKRGSFRKSVGQAPVSGEVITVLKFGIMTLEGEGQYRPMCQT